MVIDKVGNLVDSEAIDAASPSRAGQHEPCKARRRDSKGIPRVYEYEVDLERHDVLRSVKRYSYRIKAHDYIASASNGKLPLEVQAAFQVARPILESLRESRILITKSLTWGSRSWKTALARIDSFELSLNDRNWSPYLRTIVSRYLRYCHSEIKQTKGLLLEFFGILPENYYHWPYGPRVKPRGLMSSSTRLNSGS